LFSRPKEHLWPIHAYIPSAELLPWDLGTHFSGSEPLKKKKKKKKKKKNFSASDFQQSTDRFSWGSWGPLDQAGRQ